MIFGRYSYMIKGFNKKRILAFSVYILLLTSLTGSLIFAHVEANMQDKNDTSVMAETTIPITETTSPFEDSENKTYKRKDVSSKSPNGELNAEVVRKDSFKFDSVVFTDKNSKSQVVDLVNIIYTSIVSASWIDDIRYGICGHINPSLNVYVVVDTKINQIIGEYYGLGFTWNLNKNKLYYIQTSPHFADEIVSDKIVDNDDHIYYESESGTTLGGKLAVSDDERTFAFYVDDSIEETRKLYIAGLNKNNKLEKRSELNVPYGDIRIEKNNIIITEQDGNSKVYSID